MHLMTAFCKQNLKQLTLAFCGVESCMLTLTVSEHVDEGRVFGIGSGVSSYPEDDKQALPSFPLHLQLLPCQVDFLARSNSEELAE